jgi:hypothetical protein
VQSRWSRPTFQRRMLPPSSGLFFMLWRGRRTTPYGLAMSVPMNQRPLLKPIFNNNICHFCLLLAAVGSKGFNCCTTTGPRIIFEQKRPKGTVGRHACETIVWDKISKRLALGPTVTPYDITATTFTALCSDDRLCVPTHRLFQSCCDIGTTAVCLMAHECRHYH